MELRQFEHFLAVVEERHFTRAARRVHIAQSSLSSSIRALERELGSELLIRSSRRVELTEAGRALVPAARRALAATQDGRDAVDAVRGVLRGRLDIGVIQSVGIVDLPALLAAYRGRYPGVTLRLRNASVGDLVQMTLDGDLDLAFVDRPLDGRRLREIPFGVESLVLAVPAGDPLAARRVVRLDELAEREFVEYRADSALRARIDQVCAQVGLRRRVCCEVDTLAQLVELVGHGLGPALLPPLSVRRADRVVAIRTEPDISRELLAVTAAERPPAPATAALLAMLESEQLDPDQHAERPDAQRGDQRKPHQEHDDEDDPRHHAAV
ncbi:LysR family transcriptional regulator [Pseudonocardia acaciae]|uniref:LysR family transcriptional regulator n=1 Tax=Pseudonocardia acaciae TaxID=551276 RepID=UPI0007E8B6DC|nr:LysR substrate-binding domain-containing protein [Pseudonocardia acaciae]